MPVKFKPSDVSRELVQEVLRASTSISPDCRAVKRSLAVSGANFTFFGSPNIAAASARQKSTSRPAQLPCWSGSAKPAKPGFVPHTSAPRAFTALRVWADAGKAAVPNAAANRVTTRARFMAQLLRYSLFGEDFFAVA